MNTQQIDCFLCVVKHMNFTKAAEELSLSQPSISRHISLLEDELGFVLFNRSNKVTKLTPGGVIMFHELSRLQTELSESVRKASLAVLGAEGSLSIGCLSGTDTKLFVVPPTNHFASRYPNIEISIEKNSFGALRSKLDSRELDVIFTLHFEKSSLNDALYRDVYPATAGLILSKRNPLAAKPDLEIKDLQNELFVTPGQSDAFGRVFEMETLLGHYGITNPRIKTVSNTESAFLNVQMGKGIAISDTSSEWVSNDQFVFLPFDMEKAPLNMILVYKKEITNPIIPYYLEFWDNYEEIDVFQY